MGERIMWYQRKDHKCVAVLHIIKPIDHHRKFLVSTKSTTVKCCFMDNHSVSVLTRSDCSHRCSYRSVSTGARADGWGERQGDG